MSLTHIAAFDKPLECFTLAHESVARIVIQRVIVGELDNFLLLRTQGTVCLPFFQLTVRQQY